MSGLDIAWCGPEAAPVVHELTQLAFGPQALRDPPSGAVRETLEVVAADLTEGRGVLARCGSRPVAAARVLLPEDHLHLRRLAVHPELQRRGIATAVMEWTHAQASALGYHEVRLGVRKAVMPNQALYEKLGYSQVADHGFWIELALVLAGGATHPA